MYSGAVVSSSVGSGALVGRKLGKYELLHLLAVGGTAEIYLARIAGEAGFEKYVVVKSLLDHLADEEEYVKMFLDEARLGAQLDHSNIVQTLELGEHRGRYFMAMEYLAGMSLAQLARKTQERVPGGYMPVDLVLGLAAQVCSGLHYAHRKAATSGQPLNLVHRDISPQNLVVSFDGVLKIVDFGIAKADVRDTNTRSGTIKGKFAYMSPEQCLAKDIDNKTDIFALGVILHELLTARRLFKRTTTFETYEAIVKGNVPKPSAINPRLDRVLDDVVMTALQYRPADRYESAEAFGQSLLSTLHKRGKSISASDVATYYEDHFEAELDEHASTMRATIMGKAEREKQESLVWGAPELLDEDDIIESHDVEPNGDEDGDQPADATRIELNPLEKAEDAHRGARRRDASEEGRETDVESLLSPKRRRAVPGDDFGVETADPTAPEDDADTIPPSAGVVAVQRTIAPGGAVPVDADSPAPVLGVPRVPAGAAAARGRAGDEDTRGGRRETRETIDLRGRPPAERTGAKRTVIGISPVDISKKPNRPSTGSGPAPAPKPRASGSEPRPHALGSTPRGSTELGHPASAAVASVATARAANAKTLFQPAQPAQQSLSAQREEPASSAPADKQARRSNGAPPDTLPPIADPSKDQLVQVARAAATAQARDSHDAMPLNPGPHSSAELAMAPMPFSPHPSTARQLAPFAPRTNPWFVALIFIVALGFGLGATLLIARLVS